MQYRKEEIMKKEGGKTENKWDNKRKSGKRSEYLNL